MQDGGRGVRPGEAGYWHFRPAGDIARKRGRQAHCWASRPNVPCLVSGGRRPEMSALALVTLLQPPGLRYTRAGPICTAGGIARDSPRNSFITSLSLYKKKKKF